MYNLKPVHNDDIPELSKVMARVFTDADPEKPWDEDRAREYLLYWLKKQPDMFFGAFDKNGKPVGAMAVNIKPWRTSVRCSDGVIFVDTEHQRSGIATQLFQKVLTEAIEKYNATTFEAITFSGKKFPLSWYEKIGITTDEHVVLIKGDNQDILKRLSG